jgi:hypothetical protein
MNRCPKCGSTNILGLVAAFWVRVDENGDPVGDPSWRTESEVTEQRMCGECGEELEP